MPTYIKKYNGYIADVANQIFKRSDGRRFYYDKATATNFTPSQESTPINGGQGVAPLAFINGQQTLEITFTSAEFSMEMFEAANDINGDTNEYAVEKAEKFPVDESHKITLPAGVDGTKVYIDKFEATEGELTSGKYKVAVVAEGGDTITFHTDVEAGEEVLVFYTETSDKAYNLNVTTDAAAARGEVIMTWPVLSASDDGATSSVKGQLQIVVPMARVTAMPGFDTSYKTAATNAVTFSAMDAHKADGSWYSMHFISND